ncbi:hypothetical protein [Nocardioides sp. Soil796]|uniref:hypothetical protein n=1 Tax=Nocardioides sp. Soil796 TaxID=1736412 RepID=UPI000A9BEA86|nr:hypothetical protein [Nocardioides sp. Soil796]
MTSPENLRERIAHELDTLAPTDVVARARSAGERRLRRRRVSTGVAVLSVAALAVGGHVVGTNDPAPGSDDRDQSVAVDPATAPDLRDTATAVIADARADGKVTEKEWNDVLDATFDALLPKRFDGVDQVHRRDGITVLRTRGDNPRFDSGIGIQGYEGARSHQPGYGGCDGLREVAAEANFTWEIVDCADGTTGGGKLVYLADREFSALGNHSSNDESDPDAPVGHGAAVIVLGDNFFLEWGMFAHPDENAQIAFTADEMAAVVKDPLFLDAAEAGTTYFAQRPRDPRSATVDVDPVWPR